MGKKIVVFALDDDEEYLYLLKRFLTDIPEKSIEFVPFTDWKKCRAAISEQAFDVLFIDFHMEALTGLEAVRELRASGEKRQIIVFTGKGDEKIAARITREGADDYLIKGEMTKDLLRRAIDNAMARYRTADEKDLLEKQLQESRRIEMLGTFAGGIAHDFNNLLMSIMGSAEFARMKSKDPGIIGDLDNIISTSRQMAELVGQLLSFSRNEESRIEPVDLGLLISDSVNILRHTLPGRTKINVEKQADRIFIKGNAALLNQVILNICINASESMPEGGTIHIGYDYLKTDTTSLHPGLPPGENVLLEIRDEGRGMSSETRQRIFEPFFTTKKLNSSKGTGLGLAIVWENMKKMKGIIDVCSELNQGSAFKLYFSAERIKTENRRPEKVENTSGRQEIILAIDDETIVLELLEKMLTRLGYKAYTAPDCTSALDILKELKEEVRLVILDISMPVTGGQECIKEILEITPDVKVLFSSGHDMTAEIRELQALGATGIIQKPYFMADLGKRIVEVMEED